MEISAYTISEKPSPWHTYEIHRINLVDGKQPDSHKPRDYIQYLADKRNRAVTKLLETFPATTDILCCDSHYCLTGIGIDRLIADYRKIGGNCFLSGAVWGYTRTRIGEILKPSNGWFDKWGVPELRFASRGWNPSKDPLVSQFPVPLKGLYRVHSVTGIHVFPRTVWENGLRYRVMDDLHVCEHGALCEDSGLPAYVDFNTEFQRTKMYSIPHCIRNSLGRILH